jgi:REP element-mobilizing transposase RayT
MFVPGESYFVTVRNLHGRLLLRPSAQTNAVLGGVLARSIRIAGVEVFAFAFASNHVHLLVRAPRGNLPRFMQHLLTNISKKIGALVAWRGAFWERRYSAEPVLDEDALLERLRYIIAHGVKEGLVATCSEWPGLSSIPFLLDPRPRRFRWFSWSDRWKHRSRGTACARFDERCASVETLSLTPLPAKVFQNARSRRRFLREAVAAIEKEAARTFRRFLGRLGVLRQDPQSRPERPERSPRPACHTSSRVLREEYLERYRAFREAFRTASLRWRSGDLHVVFPPGAIRPFIWSAPLPASVAA